MDSIRDICVGLVAGTAAGLLLGYRLWATDQADDERPSEQINPDSQRPRPDEIREEIQSDVADARSQSDAERVRDLEERAADKAGSAEQSGGDADELVDPWGDGGDDGDQS